MMCVLVQKDNEEQPMSKKDLEVFLRRQKVWNLYIQGFTHEQIAKKEGVHPKTVSRDLNVLKIGAIEWMETLPKGEIQVYYKMTFELIDVSINEMWKLFEKTEDEKLKLNILRTITEKCKLKVDLMDPNRLLKIRDAIHDELSPRNPFDNSFDFTRRKIDYEKIVNLDKSEE